MGTFDALWANHPALKTPPIIEPCAKNGIANHANQCVIRLGVALSASGISLASYRGAFCWNGHSRAHPLRVEEYCGSTPTMRTSSHITGSGIRATHRAVRRRIR
ncbi:MAG TPA: hypothetical protein VER33_07460, partial [Polyangiaceae bacterium]|nr:hypothetical protein [Polyangiaceae bacterium]